MPRKDTFHDIVKTALIKDGWTITHDPYPLEFNREPLYVDIGAEASIAAERAGQKIAVDVKSFIGRSGVTDLYNALGQYILYRALMKVSDPERILYLAMPVEAYDALLDSTVAHAMIGDESLKLLLYAIQEAKIDRWID